ncbi:O-antigen ligase family protein [Patescibacteria group bacterium]|nr:O-antigen ligase family protein [Patescibacteria group bacterium]
MLTFPVALLAYLKKGELVVCYILTVVFFSLSRFDSNLGVNFFGYYKSFLLTFLLITSGILALLWRPIKINRFFVLLSIAILFSYIITIIIGIDYMPEFLYAFVWDGTLLFFSIIIFNVISKCRNPFYLLVFLYILILINSIFSLISLYFPSAYSSLIGLVLTERNFGHSLFGNPVPTSVLVAIGLSLFLFIDFRRYLGYIWGLILNFSKLILFINLILIQRRSSLVYITVIIIVFFFFEFRGNITKKLKTIGITILILILLFISQNYLVDTFGINRYTHIGINDIIYDSRFVGLNNALELSAMNYFLPYGIGNVYERVYESERYFMTQFYVGKNVLYINDKYVLIQAHNFYEWILLEYGIVALVLFILMLFYLLWNNIRYIHNSEHFQIYATTVIMVMTVFMFDSFPMNHLKLSVVFIIIFSLNIIKLTEVKFNERVKKKYLAFSNEPDIQS